MVAAGNHMVTENLKAISSWTIQIFSKFLHTDPEQNCLVLENLDRVGIVKYLFDDTHDEPENDKIAERLTA